MKYKRILLKISGEMLCGPLSFGLHIPTLTALAEELKSLNQAGVQIALVVGGGNIFRGGPRQKDQTQAIDRASSDYMGMLATCINGLALQSVLESKGLETRVQTALKVSSAAEPYIRRKALRHLQKKRLVIFAAGTGNPYFTTDTAAALRAMEMQAEILLKATKVDGVYDKDPASHKTSKKFTRLKYMEVLNKEIKVMDSTAVSLCMDNKMPLMIFPFKPEGNIVRIVKGESLGTMVC